MTWVKKNHIDHYYRGMAQSYRALQISVDGVTIARHPNAWKGSHIISYVRVLYYLTSKLGSQVIHQHM